MQIQALGVFLLLVGAASGLAAQDAPSTPAPSPTSKKAPSKPMTIVGCVAGASAPDQWTLADTNQQATYRLTGSNMREYVGQRVQIVGNAPKKFSVVGGLLPSPNVAAQAGAIDPVKAAEATVGAGAGNPAANIARLPEFRVRSVRPVPGGCPIS
jgi:hypothetical protein